MDVDFEMFASTDKWQEIPREMFKKLGKNECNLRGSYKLICNCERKFKAWVDHSVKNTILGKATKQAQNKCLKKRLKYQK